VFEPVASPSAAPPEPPAEKTVRAEQLSVAQAPPRPEAAGATSAPNAARPDTARPKRAPRRTQAPGASPTRELPGNTSTPTGPHAAAEKRAAEKVAEAPRSPGASARPDPPGAVRVRRGAEAARASAGALGDALVGPEPGDALSTSAEGVDKSPVISAMIRLPGPGATVKLDPLRASLPTGTLYYGGLTLLAVAGAVELPLAVAAALAGALLGRRRLRGPRPQFSLFDASPGSTPGPTAREAATLPAEHRPSRTRPHRVASTAPRFRIPPRVATPPR
jgi:hypothetical protein